MSQKYSFEQIYAWLKEYKEQYGNLLVTARYVRPDGIKLGHIVNWIRSGSRKLSVEEKEKLNELGFVWKITEKKGMIPMQVIIREFKRYKEEYNTCSIPLRYVTPNGIKLGYEASYIRYGRRKITPEERKKLDDLGFIWRAEEKIVTMDEVIDMIKKYKEEYGNCLIPSQYVTPEGIKLGGIVSNIKIGTRKVSDEERKKLDELGFDWFVQKRNKRTNFNEVYMYLKEYKEKFGNLRIPKDYITEDNIKLGLIVKNIRYGKRFISSKQRQKLDELGFIWPKKQYNIGEKLS